MRLLLIAALLLVATPAIASDFCDGYKAGYEQGYCYQEAYCLKPLPPFCPFPGFGERTFQDGYNRGFVDGVGDKR